MQFRNFIALKSKVQQVSQLLQKILAVPRKVQENIIHDEADKYWNDEKLLSWLKSHNIQPPSGIPPFADGGSGRVYFIGNRYVVKFSKNPIEANVANMVAGRTDLPTAIIDVLSLNGSYAILQHYVDMKSTSKDIKQGADYLTYLIDNDPDILEKGFPKEPQKQKSIITKYLGNIDMNLMSYIMHMMDILNQLYQATGFLHSDAVPVNLGMWQNKVRIPDLGPNMNRNDNPEKWLNTIDRARANLNLPSYKRI